MEEIKNIWELVNHGTLFYSTKWKGFVDRTAAEDLFL